MSANRDSTFCNAEGPKGAKLALREMPGLHKGECEEKIKKIKKIKDSIEELLLDKG